MPVPFVLSSAAFVDHGEIPTVFTCEGRNISPALSFASPPPAAHSFVLLVHDPDVPDPKHPTRTWVHWVLYNLPATTMSLPEGVDAAHLPAGTLQGQNDWKKPGYGGPCPPVGRHRYVHTLYALDVVLPDLDKPTRDALLAAMKGHVIGEATLTGTYEKHRSPHR